MYKFFALLISAAAVAAQDIPLKNWQAPLYWQPSEAEASRMRPELGDPAPSAATPVGSLIFVAMTPCRVVDTRSNCTLNPGLCSNTTFGPPSLAANMARSFPLQSSTNCTIPSNAMAYSLNVTVLPNPPGTFVGFLIMWATGTTQPNVATLDDAPGDIRNDTAIVAAGTPNGSVSEITNGHTDLVIDINGYYAPLTGVTLAQGTAAAPSLSFSGDSGTGIFSSGMGALNFTTGGTNALTIRSDQDLDLAGNVRKGGALFIHNLGTNDTAIGLGALNPSTTGSDNTASGARALAQNTTGTENTASGSDALFSNTTGGGNTANGANALVHNTTANGNTASGANALFSNTTGFDNTASGANALESNNTGGFNMASGVAALERNITGASTRPAGSRHSKTTPREVTTRPLATTPASTSPLAATTSILETPAARAMARPPTAVLSASVTAPAKPPSSLLESMQS